MALEAAEPRSVRLTSKAFANMHRHQERDHADPLHLFLQRSWRGRALVLLQSMARQADVPNTDTDDDDDERDRCVDVRR